MAPAPGWGATISLIENAPTGEDAERFFRDWSGTVDRVRDHAPKVASIDVAEGMAKGHRATRLEVQGGPSKAGIDGHQPEASSSLDAPDRLGGGLVQIEARLGKSMAAGSVRVVLHEADLETIGQHGWSIVADARSGVRFRLKKGTCLGGELGARTRVACFMAQEIR